MRKFSVILLVSTLLAAFPLLLGAPEAASADAPYKTYTVDHGQGFIRTQDAYTPAGSIERIGDLELKEPSDLFVDRDGRLYVADTGNGRIVAMDLSGKLLRTFGEDVLGAPTGVYADEGGYIFAADPGKGQVVKFDPSGQAVQTYKRPESPLYGKNTPFKPMKAATDKRGNLYIVSEGTSSGLVQLSPQGDFLGFFGSNEAAANVKIALQRMIFTKEQRAKLFKNVPPSPTNLSIDGKGLIYTVTQGEKMRSVKKFNISGRNLLPPMYYELLYTDLTVGPNGHIYAVSQDGFLNEFDTEGNLLFIFGASDDGRSRVGLFVNASGIAVDAKQRIFVLDKERADIQLFEPTEFTNQVHEALALYREGFYVKSEQPWREVLKKNGLFDLAHNGLGDAYYKRQLYAESMEEYVIAGDREGYSQAFWEVRNRWLQNNLLAVFLWAAGAYAFWKLLRWTHRRTGAFNFAARAASAVYRYAIIRDLHYLFRMIRHPIDGFYGIKEENKTSVWSASLLYALFFAETIFAIYCTGFIFQTEDPSYVQLSRVAAFAFGPFALWVLSNYLVSTISDGEGKFSQVFKGTVYAFAPYLIFKPVLVVASNVLTMNDAFVYSFSGLLIQAWTGILLFLMVKEIHNFTFGETVKNIFITLFCMVIMLLVLFIVYVLLDQVYDFVHSVIREGIIRAES